VIFEVEEGSWHIMKGRGRRRGLQHHGYASFSKHIQVNNPPEGWRYNHQEMVMVTIQMEVS